MRLAAFIIALLLLGGAIDPTQGWLIALVVVTGLGMFRWRWYYAHPVVDVGLASFIIAVLLLAGTIDPTKDWLIGLSIATGLAMVMRPGMLIDPFGFNERAWRRRERRWWRGHGTWFADDAWSADDDGWRRWESRMDERREHVRDYGR